ncbi:MAG: CDP-diacylglycerol--glycerol-3-phosphate 3-phosphatidyltransferase [Akkermansiaceae bacterium]|nr:CDP-diacylglycerol--glycerol-3-phosphate 3-phosphatidyltransferase [Akkermansiaceae bacterium]
MNLPNSISLARLVLTVVFITAVSFPGPAGYGIALAAFVAGTISDWLDGYLARRLGLVTSLGKLLDPIADKVLVAAAFVFLTPRFCPVWATVLILTREFLVTGLRQIAVEKGEVIAAAWSGKWKTGFQLAFCITALLWLFLQARVEAAGPAGPGDPSFLARLSDPGGWLQPLLLWLAVGLTGLSGLHYLWNGRGILRDATRGTA